MNRPGKPVRTTIVLGLAFGLLFVPLSAALNLFFPWPAAFRLTLWSFTAVYSMMLCRWAGASPPACGFPVALLLASAFYLRSGHDFLFLAVLVLAWVRSGVCFRKPLWKAVGAEVLVGMGGAALVACFIPHSTAAWALGVWMFFLVQSLYFVLTGNAGDLEEAETVLDPFEKARRQAEEILAAGNR
ncbi:MAG: hypothetical protein AB9866_20880 [Syntrophobacteraceae bacterium]